MNHDDNTIRIKQVDWHVQKERIMQIRTPVFVKEQQVDMTIELDGLDELCLFVLAENASGEAIGTCRLLPDGKIGRLAVLKEYRNRGIGSAMLQAIIDIAHQRGLDNVYLHGQIQARAFYMKQGFIAEGDEFDEAGIPHIKMRFNAKPEV